MCCLGSTARENEKKRRRGTFADARRLGWKNLGEDRYGGNKIFHFSSGSGNFMKVSASWQIGKKLGIDNCLHNGSSSTTRKNSPRRWKSHLRKHARGFLHFHSFSPPFGPVSLALKFFYFKNLFILMYANSVFIPSIIR